MTEANENVADEKVTTEMTEEEKQQRTQLYLELVDKLLRCENGKEPEVLDANLELVDPGFVSILMQVATSMAHNDNPDGAKFLIFVARELSRQLGLYPEVFNKEAPAQ